MTWRRAATTWLLAAGSGAAVACQAVRIVFSSERNGGQHLFLMNADGSGVTQLTFGTGQEYGGSWSPDGARIVFPSYRNGQYGARPCEHQLPA